MIRTYSDLSRLQTLEERFDYLQLRGQVGDPTFGSERWLNQRFYHSKEWREVRSYVIARDLGCDLGDPDFVVRRSPIIHHMNPLVVEDITEATDNLLDPEFLITTSLHTHNAIHYGDEKQLPRRFVERTPGDTAPWLH